MMGLGLWELALIFLVVLIVIKPEDLPAFVRKVGAIYRKVRASLAEAESVRDAFLKESDAVLKDEDRADDGDVQAHEEDASFALYRETYAAEKTRAEDRASEKTARRKKTANKKAVKKKVAKKTVSRKKATTKKKQVKRKREE